MWIQNPICCRFNAVEDLVGFSIGCKLPRRQTKKLTLKEKQTKKINRDQKRDQKQKEQNNENSFRFQRLLTRKLVMRTGSNLNIQLRQVNVQEAADIFVKPFNETKPALKVKLIWVVLNKS
jgi:hypothetical protein